MKLDIYILENIVKFVSFEFEGERHHSADICKIPNKQGMYKVGFSNVTIHSKWNNLELYYKQIPIMQCSTIELPKLEIVEEIFNIKFFELFLGNLI